MHSCFLVSELLLPACLLLLLLSYPCRQFITLLASLSMAPVYCSSCFAFLVPCLLLFLPPIPRPPVYCCFCLPFHAPCLLLFLPHFLCPKFIALLASLSIPPVYCSSCLHGPLFICCNNIFCRRQKLGRLSYRSISPRREIITAASLARL